MSSNPADRCVDAISAVLMTDTLLGDVTRESGLGSHAEWIVTAPTNCHLYTCP
jgi:hypothetical protein